MLCEHVKPLCHQIYIKTIKINLFCLRQDPIIHTGQIPIRGIDFIN